MGNKAEMTRNAILEAAVALFSEKGFDGSGIRELAERAGVTKSLLYYHFKNKEEILHQLIHNVFLEMEEVFKRILDERDAGEWVFEDVVDQLERLFLKRRDAVRIVFAEALRSGDLRGVMLRHLVAFQKKTWERLKQHGVVIRNRQKMLMERFFFGFGPFFLFLFFQEQWLEYTGVSVEESGSLFRELMAEQVKFYSASGWGRTQ